MLEVFLPHRVRQVRLRVCVVEEMLREVVLQLLVDVYQDPLRNRAVYLRHVVDDGDSKAVLRRVEIIRDSDQELVDALVLDDGAPIDHFGCVQCFQLCALAGDQLKSARDSLQLLVGTMK